jgi:hypothetical protein
VAIQGSTLKIAVPIRATAGQLHFSRVDMRGGDGVSAEALLSHHIWTFILLVRKGKFYDQGDAKWTVIRGQLRGHNDMPQGIFGGFSYYYLVMIFYNIVPLIMEFP